MKYEFERESAQGIADADMREALGMSVQLVWDRYNDDELEEPLIGRAVILHGTDVRVSAHIEESDESHVIIKVEVGTRHLSKELPDETERTEKA